MLPKNKFYPLHLWLTSIAVVSIYLIFKKEFPGSVAYFPLFVTFGLFISFPTFIICHIAFKLLIEKNLSGVLIKIILDLIAVLGIFLTLFVVSRGSSDHYLNLIYSSGVIFSSLLLKVYQKPQD